MNETTDLCCTLPLILVVILEHFILLSKQAMDPMLDEDSLDDDDDDDDEPTVVKRMTGKVTVKNPNYEKKKRCNCKKGCSKRSCSCFKFGSGCNATCGCGPSCANMFKHLDYFFGENQTCNPHTCFTQWLVKHAKDANELKSIDRDALRERILQCRRSVHTLFSSEKITID